MLRELPPTAGLPLEWSDFVAFADDACLEDHLAKLLAVPAVQIESSGTACLIIALETLKTISPRRTVVLPAYTCPLVAIAAAQAGLKIRLCDTRADSFEFDLNQLSRVCDRDTLAIVPTHVGGLVADLEPVIKIAANTGAYVIEDAAAALGARSHDQMVGTQADIGFFSLTVGKGLTIYEGGVLAAKDDQMRLALMQTSARLVKDRPGYEAIRLAKLLGYRMLYNPFGLYFSYGLGLRRLLQAKDYEQAAGDVFAKQMPLNKVSLLRKRIASLAFKRLPEALAANVERGRARAAKLSDIAGLRVLKDNPHTIGTWPFLMAVCDSARDCEAALAELWPSGLGVTKLFVSDLTGYKYLEDIVPRESVPNAKSFADRCLTVSNSPLVSAADFQNIADRLQKALSCESKTLSLQPKN